MDLLKRKMEIQNAVKADLEKKKIAEIMDIINETEDAYLIN